MPCCASACRSSPGATTRTAGWPSTSSPTPRTSAFLTGHAGGAHHHQHRRGGLGRARAAAGGAARAAAHRCSATCATRSAHYYWDAARPRQRPARHLAPGLRRRTADYGEALKAYYRDGPPRGLVDSARQRIRHRAPLRGLRRDLDPLPAHGRHPRHRRELRPRGGAGGRRAIRASRAQVPEDPYRCVFVDDLVRAWRPMTVGGERPEPQHGPARPLSVLPEPDRHRKGSASSTCCVRADRARTTAAPKEDNPMRVFTCQNCGQLLHFENTVCMRCGLPLGFLPAADAVGADAEDGRRLTAHGRRRRAGGAARNASDGALQLAGARRTTRRLLPGLRSQPHHPRPRRRPAMPSAGRRWRRRSGGSSMR